LWPAVSPHGPEIPTSIWNLPYWTWRRLALAADQYEEGMKQS
jgi:hypothetical protein